MIYFFYFHEVFLHLNSLLSSITLDSIKNYYTFVYHIRNDDSLLHFSGMNYPFGEHVVYTDCHPLLSGFLQLFPLLQPYSIGILHGLLFLSFIIAPVFLFLFMRSQSTPLLPALLFSLSIALLSPQFQKINGGHHALAYGCVFPVSIWLLWRYLTGNAVRPVLYLFVFNLLIFFIHPYLGFALALFSFTTILCFDISVPERRKNLRPYLINLLTSLLPMLIFRLFMKLTDKHPDRPSEPYGSDILVENAGSLMVPVFGPFRELLEKAGPEPTMHFEGHSYLGISTLILFVITLFRLPLIFRKKILSGRLCALLLSSLVMLMISFGYHQRLLDAMGISVPDIKQFRAVCRFSWVFYFVFPVVLVSLLYKTFETRRGSGFFNILTLILFSLSVLEAHSYFRLNDSAYWKFRNFFNPALLNAEEMSVLAAIRNEGAQALIPLPIFHGGSEMYDRPGSSNSMVPAMLYSYHSGKPLVSMMASRASISETETLIGSLNSYKKDNPAQSIFTGQPFVILRTGDQLLPDEDRLFSKSTPLLTFDSLQVAGISKEKFFDPHTRSTLRKISGEQSYPPDSGIVYIPQDDRKPFRTAHMDHYEKIWELPADELGPGQYVLSLHYYYPVKKFQWLSTNLIIAEGEQENYQWIRNVPLRNLSGFYEGFGVFEYYLEVQAGKRYEFILKGTEDKEYHISDFLIRPVNLDVFIAHSKGNMINNFPE